MHPILFKLGPITIYSYGTLMAVAFMVSSYLIIKKLERSSLIKKNQAIDLLFCILVSGILGARLLHVILNIDYYINDPVTIFFIHKGGLAFHGGIICAVGASVWFLKMKNLAIWKTADIIAPYVALGHAIGRIGCFLNGCCFGKDGHPTQLYSALGLFIMFLILRSLYSRRGFDGQIFLSYIIFYSIFRFFIDFLRGDLLPVWFGLTASQLINIIVLVIGIIIWRRIRQGSGSTP